MAKRKVDTQTMTEFKRGNTAAVVQKLKRSGRPLTLTVDGEPSLVVLDAEAFRRLEERARAAEDAEYRQFLLESQADIDAGRTVPAREFLLSLGKKPGPRR